MMKNRLNANKGKYEVIASLLRDCENVEDAVIKIGDYFQTKDETFDQHNTILVLRLVKNKNHPL